MKGLMTRLNSCKTADPVNQGAEHNAWPITRERHLTIVSDSQLSQKVIMSEWLLKKSTSNSLQESIVPHVLVVPERWQRLQCYGDTHAVLFAFRCVCRLEWSYSKCTLSF